MNNVGTVRLSISIDCEHFAPALCPFHSICKPVGPRGCPRTRILASTVVMHTSKPPTTLPCGGIRLWKQVHLHTQGENSTHHKQTVNRTMDTFVCAHSEVSLQYSVNNPVNQSYASSAYIQMQAGFLHQARSTLTCKHCLKTQNEHIRMCTYYAYVYMLNSILLHRDANHVKVHMWQCQ